MCNDCYFSAQPPPPLLGCLRRMNFGLVRFLEVCFLYKPRGIFCCWKKVSQMPLFNLVFLGLGWPSVGEFVGFLIIVRCFLTQKNLVKSQTPYCCCCCDAVVASGCLFLEIGVACSSEYCCAPDVQQLFCCGVVLPPRLGRVSLRSHRHLNGCCFTFLFLVVPLQIYSSYFFLVSVFFPAVLVPRHESTRYVCVRA